MQRLHDLPAKRDHRFGVVGMTLKVDPVWAATHRHRKGGLYRVLGQAVLEADRSDVVIYDDAEGQVWVRPVEEFHDGRFSPVTLGMQPE